MTRPSRLRALLAKEWRDHRTTFGLACAVACGFFWLLEVLAGERSDPELRAATIRPLGLCVFAALWTAEVFANDVQRGIERTLRSLAVPPALAWCAKLLFAGVGVAAFALLLTGLEHATRLTEGPQHAEQVASAWISSGWSTLLAIQVAVVAALAVLLRRSLSSVLAGLLLVAGLARLVWLLPANDLAISVELALSTWSPGVLATAVVVLALAISFSAYTHRLRGSTARRRALATTAVGALLFLPVGVPAAMRPTRFRAFEPLDPGVFVTAIWPSPAGDFLAVALERRVSPKRWVPSLRVPALFGAGPGVEQIRVYDVARRTWRTAKHPRREFGVQGVLGSRSPWDARGRLAMFGDERFDIYDPRADELVFARAATAESLAAWRTELDADSWATVEPGPGGQRVDWHATGASLEVPHAFLALSPEPAMVYFQRGPDMMVADLIAGDERTLGRCAEPAFPRLSPDGAYLCVHREGAGLRLFETATGRVVFESDRAHFACWSPHPERVMQTSGDDRGVVTKQGEVVPLPTHDLWVREVGPDRWIRFQYDRIELLDADGRPIDVLYDHPAAGLRFEKSVRGR